MRKIHSVLCAALMLAGTAGVSSANNKGVLFVDHGVLTSVSEQGVLKMDTATGDMYISTPHSSADRPLYFPGNRKVTPAFQPNALVFLGAKGTGPQKMVGDCSFKQQTLDDATRFVLSACGAGGSQFMCGLARTAANEAWRQFELCANNLPEP